MPVANPDALVTLSSRHHGGDTIAVKDLTRLSAFKTEDTPRANDDAVSDDPHLIVEVRPLAIYAVNLFAVLTCASAAPDIAITMRAPSGSIGHFVFLGVNEGTTNAQHNALDLNSERNIAINAGAERHSNMKGVLRVGEVDGMCAFQWAQGSANATPTIVRANSWMILERLF